MNFRDLRSGKCVSRDMGISVSAVNLLRARGTLPGHRVGLVWLYLAEDVARVMKDPDYKKKTRRL